MPRVDSRRLLYHSVFLCIHSILITHLLASAAGNKAGIVWILTHQKDVLGNVVKSAPQTVD